MQPTQLRQTGSRCEYRPCGTRCIEYLLPFTNDGQRYSFEYEVQSQGLVPAFHYTAELTGAGADSSILVEMENNVMGPYSQTEAFYDVCESPPGHFCSFDPIGFHKSLKHVGGASIINHHPDHVTKQAPYFDIFSAFLLQSLVKLPSNVQKTDGS
jgi:hypothetical protein